MSSVIATMVLAPVVGQSSERYTRNLLAVGSVAPSFSVNGVRGGKVSFVPSKEKVDGYVVVFWHVGDRMAAPLFKYLQGVEKNGKKKIKVIAVNHGDGKGRTAEFLKENKLNLVCGVSMPTKDKLADKFGVRGFPTGYVMDGKGVIVYRDHKPSVGALGSAIGGL